MQVLLINGSPRLRGNTWTLLDQVRRAAVRAGAATEEIILHKLDIRPCHACESCRKALECHIKDDMTLLYPKVLSADVIVFGTPVYFWSMTAQMKAFVDRWYALDLDPIRPKMAGKRLGLVVCYADPTTETASGVVFAFKSAAVYFDM
ncbi:MAG: flavodoxin family protein [Anaerolineae bacterium]